jgi:hypothetical protein
MSTTMSKYDGHDAAMPPEDFAIYHWEELLSPTERHGLLRTITLLGASEQLQRVVGPNVAKMLTGLACVGARHLETPTPSGAYDSSPSLS